MTWHRKPTQCLHRENSQHILFTLFAVVVVVVFVLLTFNAKSFAVSIWCKAWLRTLGWLQSCLVAAGRGSGRSPAARGRCRGALQRQLGSRGSAHTAGGAFLQTGLGAGSLQGWVQSGGGHVLDDFHLLILEAALQEATEMGGSAGQNPGQEGPQGLGSGSSPGQWQLPECPGFNPIHLGTASVTPGRGRGFASSRDAGCP